MSVEQPSADPRLDKIEAKLDDIMLSLKHIDVAIASQRIILKEHIKRAESTEKRFAKVERHVVMVEGIAQFIFMLSLIATIVAGLISLVKCSV